MKGIEALKQLRQNNKDDTHLFDDELLDVVEKELKALEIIAKYIKIDEEDEDDFFPYTIKDTQYISLSSAKVMTKEEYEIIKEVLKWLKY